MAENLSLGRKWYAQDEEAKNKEKEKDDESKEEKVEKPYKHCKINMARNFPLCSTEMHVGGYQSSLDDAPFNSMFLRAAAKRTAADIVSQAIN